MEYSSFYKSVLDQDRCAVVLCNLQHEIVYMNEAAAVNYAKWGGKELLGKSLLNCHNVHSNDMIKQVVDWFAVAGVILGAVVANIVPYGIASINGMAVAAVCYLIGRKVNKNR